ncbi:hypothetical protein [Mycobacterium rhizamassiliense]|nr:hypothetical protein [Mycobacterium rhizamassiliense]
MATSLRAVVDALVLHCPPRGATTQTKVDDAESRRVQGSNKQPLAMPELVELRQYRAQFVALIKQLDLFPPPEGDEDEGAGIQPDRPMFRSEAGRAAAAPRWGHRNRGATK